MTTPGGISASEDRRRNASLPGGVDRSRKVLRGEGGPRLRSLSGRSALRGAAGPRGPGRLIQDRRSRTGSGRRTCGSRRCGGSVGRSRRLQLGRGVTPAAAPDPERRGRPCPLRWAALQPTPFGLRGAARSADVPGIGAVRGRSMQASSRDGDLAGHPGNKPAGRRGHVRVAGVVRVGPASVALRARES
jgi:hypothetical protein